MDRYIKRINEYFSHAPNIVKALIIFAIYDGGDRYLFGMKDPKSKEEPLDPWYTIDKKTLKIKGFHPYEDWKFFEKALKHKVK